MGTGWHSARHAGALFSQGSWACCDAEGRVGAAEGDEELSVQAGWLGMGWGLPGSNRKHHSSKYNKVDSKYAKIQKNPKPRTLPVPGTLIKE